MDHEGPGEEIIVEETIIDGSEALGAPPSPLASVQGLQPSSGTSSPYSTNNSNKYSSSYAKEEDLPAYKAWLEKHNQELEQRKAASEERKRKSVAGAKEELAKLYKDRLASIEKNKHANKASQDAFTRERDHLLQSGSDWERVAFLVDLAQAQPKPGDKDAKPNAEAHAAAAAAAAIGVGGPRVDAPVGPKHPRKDLSRLRDLLLALKAQA